MIITIKKLVIERPGCGDTWEAKDLADQNVLQEALDAFERRHGKCEQQGKLPRSDR